MSVIGLQAYAVVSFAFHYAIPVITFVYCYGRLFHTIRRQGKVIAGHAGRGQDVSMATTSRDQNARQVQQQTTGTTTGDKLSHTELNVLKTMICVIVVFLIFWSVADIGHVLQRTGVGRLYTHYVYSLTEACK